MRIGYKIITIFTIVSYSILLTSGIVLIGQANGAIGGKTKDLLESVVILKQNHLNSFFDDVILDIVDISEQNLVVSRLESESSGADLDEYFSGKLKNSHFDEIFLMVMSGEIITSTDDLNQGKFKENENYFISGKSGPYIQGFYFDISLQEPSTITSAPVRNSRGQVIGVVAGRINLDSISEIMTERTGLGEQGETYLVNRYNLLVSKSRFIEAIEYKKIIYTEVIEKCIEGNSGHSHYKNYRDVMVAGSYVWIPEREVCLVAEIDEVQVYAASRELANNTIIFMALMGVLTVTAALIFSRTLTNPITRLQDAAKRVGRGDLSQKIEIKSTDELGELAQAFNNMTSDLKDYKKQIKDHSETLEKQVSDRTNELDTKVKELEDTKLAILNMMEDVDQTNTELTDAQEKLKKSLDDLKIMDKKKDEFISVAAHELKTPLTAIHGFSQLLMNDKVAGVKAKRNNYLKIMDSETNRLSRLVTDILELSRIDLGTIKLIPEKLNIKNIVHTVESEIRIHVDKKGLKFASKVDTGLPLITVDREKLTQVLLNLLNNSVKYTETGKIRLDVKKDGKLIKFIVKDTGIGIAKKDQEKIFERFFQVDSSYTRKAGGTGLGLALCKEYIELMGGKLQVESEIAKGSTFQFALPLSGSCEYRSEEEIRARETLRQTEETRKSAQESGMIK